MLLALYAPERLQEPTNPIIEAVLTIVLPPCLSIWIISYFIHNHTPFRLMLRTRSQVSSVHSCKGARGRAPIPALLWAQSNLPYVSTALLIMASTAVALDTSTWTKMASPPFSLIIWTVCCPPSSFISAMTSFAPSRANVRAVALPIPEAPPVTKATLPSTRPAMVISPAYTSCEVGHFPYIGYLWGAPAVLCAPLLYAFS